ncbi:membrane-bound lytic murein transglycosylase MltF [Azoarcus sp. DD4]|uniref:membrane-bound lytic murein transglycosylase MltF n=1 Tax=Azoarcus sp. DD4 TaxID=2027405 RepID=UPI001F117697|nr:membrane-bound lytic murein transglycosylase MltF [Azoarcus sp. DD4]
MLRILFCLLLAVMMAGCAPEKSARIADFRTLGELRVATRMDAVSYRVEADGTVSGFEYDLLMRLGETLGVPVRFIVYPDSLRAMDAVINGEAHLAAAGLARNDRLPLRWSAPLRELDYVLAGKADAAEIDRESDLGGHKVSVRRGSLPADALERIRQRVPDLQVHYPHRAGDQDLLQQLAEGSLDLVATDRVHYALAARIHPALAIVYDLPIKSHIAWAMPRDHDADLGRTVEGFLADAAGNGLIARVADRYFGHVRRLNDVDIETFLGRVQERLPRFRSHFQEAQARTGIDWRYLAALSYQESHWDPLATSRTGVRGIMMLTVDTADRLGVADRLDARQSILGGARYLAMIREQLPDEIAEPDRSWMATAAYNLGMGHMNGARAIARKLGKDDASWWEMKSVLPLLSRQDYAARLKSGPARGGEAVIMTENIRNYHDILMRIEAPFDARKAVPKLRLSASGW